jgi:hypothetical protein
MHLPIIGLQHFNVVVDDYGLTLTHLKDVFGAHVNYELEPAYLSDGVNAGLITIGPVIFELVGAALHSKNAFRRKLDRSGPGYIGIEFSVGDLDQAREAAKHNEMRVKYDAGHFFVTDPRDCFGFTIECYAGDWFNNPPASSMIPVAPRSYWANEHPLGIIGLYGFTVGVHDREAAAARWTAVSGASRLDDGADGEPLWLSAGDTRLGLVDTSNGEQILAARLEVRDIEQTRRALAAKGLKLEEIRKGLMAAPAPENHGVRIEFVETTASAVC